MTVLSPFEKLADAHLRAWMDLAASTAAVASLPVRTLQQLVGLVPAEPATATDPLVERAEAAEREAAQRLEAINGLQARLVRMHAEHQALVDELRRSYGVLEREVESRVEQARDDQKRWLYSLLEPLLTQLPVVRRSIAQGMAVDGADVVALLAPLDQALGELGFVPIGEVGAALPFDPSQHQMALGTPPEPGTEVTVKHIGYRLEAAILRKARVSLKR